MDELIKEIRLAVKKLGLNNRDVSVVRTRNYAILVSCISDKSISIKDEIKKIVESLYYKEPHAWLCVAVNNEWFKINR